jgi:MFS family permease
MNGILHALLLAQFMAALADNALLIVAIGMLQRLHAPDWMTPVLKQCFVLSYVLLAFLAGAVADALPKAKLMVAGTLLKAGACLAMFLGMHPLPAYGIAGLAAAAYSPAKFGIINELVRPEKLVAANGWAEGSAVAAIILGTVLGGLLTTPQSHALLTALGLPGAAGSGAPSLVLIGAVYLGSALINLKVPDPGHRRPLRSVHPVQLCAEFRRCLSMLWRDRLGQISLAITALFWGVGAALQFIVLAWAETRFQLSLARAAQLQGVFAAGVALGAVAASRWMPLDKAFSVMPLGVVMGALIAAMTLVHQLAMAWSLLLLIGVLAGYFVVPMNALLQYRGHRLLGTGQSIAVQNFSENLAVLVVLGSYSVLVGERFHLDSIILGLGGLIAFTVLGIMRRHAGNQRRLARQAP